MPCFPNRLLLAATAPFLLAAGPAATGPVSGQYDALLLAVSNGTVVGAYSSSRMGNGTASAPQFSCGFLLRGRLQGGRGTVVTWYPGDKPADAIPGEIAFSGSTVTVTLREDPPGCAMTGDRFAGEPDTHDLLEARPGWVGVGLVGLNRAALRPAPDAPAPRTPYLVRGDTVGVAERRGPWVKVAYPGEHGFISGWLRAEELAPDRPPGGGGAR